MGDQSVELGLSVWAFACSSIRCYGRLCFHVVPMHISAAAENSPHKRIGPCDPMEELIHGTNELNPLTENMSQILYYILEDA